MSGCNMAKYILNNGLSYPLIGFGTYTITGTSLVCRVLDDALKCGYRSLDTSVMYDNEEDIGKALKQVLPKHNLKREDIFITTKLSPSDQGHEKATNAVKTALKKLQTSYIDMFLIHWPGVEGVPETSSVNSQLRHETWQDLVKLYQQGCVKSIGVSNYTIKHLTELLSDCDGVKPVLNQVEYHPRYQQPELLEFCKSQNILLQAYCSLGGSEFTNTSLLNDPVVADVARKANKTNGQVLLRWAVQQGISVIPKTTNIDRMRQNLDLNFILDDEDMKKLNGITVREKYSWVPDNIV